MITTFLDAIGRYILMLRHAIGPLPRRAVYRRQFIQDCITIGVRTLPLVIAIAFALGMVTALMGVYMLAYPFLPKSIIGSLVRESILLELGTTGIGALLADVLGFSIAFDLGNQVLHEQVDALEVMGVPIDRYLVLPKILAGVILIPCLMVIGAVCSIVGGYCFCVLNGSVPPHDYMEGLLMDFKILSLETFLVKSFVFAFLIPSVACCMGINFRGNMEQLSRMSTRSIMYTCIAILFFDYIITMLML